jgi:hypothetical protein
MGVKLAHDRHRLRGGHARARDRTIFADLTWAIEDRARIGRIGRIGPSAYSERAA